MNTTNHRFIDEAGDTTFYLKGKKSALGTNGVSTCFIIGMLKVNDDLDVVRSKIIKLQNEIASDPFFEVPSVIKKKNKMGYFLHATDDIPEIRYKFLELIKTINCTFEAVVGEKSIKRYEQAHKGKEQYFYADLLSHLIKTKLQQEGKLVLHISGRGKSTKHQNLDLALQKAIHRVKSNPTKKIEIKREVVFNVNYPLNEPLLNLVDYFCWTVQRVFEKGETRYYERLKDKISLVVDLYDESKYLDWGNYYNVKNPLTSKNKKTHHRTIP